MKHTYESHHAFGRYCSQAYYWAYICLIFGILLLAAGIYQVYFETPYQDTSLLCMITAVAMLISFVLLREYSRLGR